VFLGEKGGERWEFQSALKLNVSFSENSFKVTPFPIQNLQNYLVFHVDPLSNVGDLYWVNMIA
jgi:hypothetical protein